MSTNSWLTKWANYGMYLLCANPAGIVQPHMGSNDGWMGQKLVQMVHVLHMIVLQQALKPQV